MDILKQIEMASMVMRGRSSLIRQARTDGFTWEQIATAAGMSRGGAIKLSKSDDGDKS